jgi:uridine phosphorylase
MDSMALRDVYSAYPLADPMLNDKIVDFSYKGENITNFEMESSAINGLSLLLGHDAITICISLPIG